MLSGPLAFYTLLDSLVQDVNTALVDAGQDAPERVCVVPGAIAWDDCECGQLAGTVLRWFFSDEFPRGLTAGTGGRVTSACSAPWVVAEMAVSILRCAPAPQGEQLAPTCAALDATAREMMIDAHITRNTIACGLQDRKDDEVIVDYIVQDQLTVGPEGMCVGSDLTFLVSLDRTI